MRIVVMSDSHGAYNRVFSAIQENPSAEVFIHLGDGLEELFEIKPYFPDKAFYWVKGNNDWSIPTESAEKTAELTLGGRKFIMTHGDRYGVKYDTRELELLAGQRGADIVLYGHTHRAAIDYMDGIYYLNPGSLWDCSRSPAGYMRIDITDAGVVPNRVVL